MTKEFLKEYKSKKEEIKEIRQEKRYEDRILILTKECEAVERFIEEIPESLLRRIFRMYYIDNLTQKEIGDTLNMERSSISKKINRYLKSFL